MPGPPKVPRPEGELARALQRQIRFLLGSCAAFDEGDWDEAHRLAGTLRLLLHDTGRSTSLLTQVGWRDRLMMRRQTLAGRGVGRPEGESISLSMSTLSTICNGPPGAWWVPLCWMDLAAVATTRADLPCPTWWEEQCGVTPAGETFTRRMIITTMANQDSVHVDPELDEWYFKITRANASGWLMRDEDGQAHDPMPDPLPAWVRQIAQEVLLSCDAVRGQMGLDLYEVPGPVPVDRQPPTIARSGPGLNLSVEVTLPASWTHPS